MFQIFNTNFFLISILNKEIVLFMPSTGLQEITYYASGRSSLRFYNRENIRDVIINENVSMVSRIRFKIKI